MLFEANGALFFTGLAIWWTARYGDLENDVSSTRPHPVTIVIRFTAQQQHAVSLSK